MSEPVEARVVAPFVGRAIEARAVAAAIEAALAGRATGVLVLGEAGIGKTRLVSEVVHAHEAGARVAWAAAWEPGGARPHWHWMQLLRAVAGDEDRSRLAQALGDDAGELARLVPDLRSGVQLGAPARAEGDDARFRMYDAVASVLRRLAERRPLLLVLDDLHAADVASLALLRFVAAETRQDPVAIVAAARDVDTAACSDAVKNELVELPRALDVLRLGGLHRDEVESLLRHLVGGDTAARLAPAIHRRSGGNPLFAAELGRFVAVGPDDGAHNLPGSVRVVIEQRFAALPPRSTDLLCAAAVVGELFTARLVEQATGASRDEVLDALDDGLRAQLLRQPGGSEFAFCHALVREVLYDRLPLAQRARTHRAVAEALEAASPADPPLAEMAHHLLAALPVLDDGKAATYAERAGRRAADQLAYEDAASHFRAALSALERGPADDPRRIGLLLAVGDATLRAGDIASARDAFVEAAGHARRLGRADLLARAAIGLGSGLDGFEVRLFDHAQIELLEEALTRLARGPSPLRAWVLARLSVALTFAESPVRRLELADEAVAMARAAADDQALAYALGARCDATSGPEATDERLHAADENIRLAHAAGDRGMELLGRRHRLIALLERGDIAGVDAEIERYGLVADAIRQPLYQWYVPVWRGMRALMDGRIDAARAHREEAAAIGARAQSHNAALSADVLAWNTLLKEGRWAEAAAGLARQLPLADGIYGEPFWIAIVTPQLHPVDAKTTLDRFLVEDFASLPRDAIWLAAMTYLADSCGVVGSRPAAERLYELILPFRSRFAVDGIGAACYGSMARPLGVLAGVLGRRAAVREHFEEALNAHRACGAAALVAETLHDLGRALALVGEVGASERAIGEARSLFHSLGMARRAELVGPAGAEPAPGSNVFRREGEYWTLTYQGRTARVADTKGLHDIAVLLAHQGREVHVADLVGLVHGTAADPILDARARAAYRSRLVELRADLDEAEANADIGRAEAARAAMDAIASELAAALGLGGRPRSAADPGERARKAVTQRIRNAIKRLQTAHPGLATHLDRTIDTGRFCVYRPERPVDWSL